MSSEKSSKHSKSDKIEKNSNNEVKSDKSGKSNVSNEQIDIKKLPSYEYFQKTVQKEIESGLIEISKIKPSNPIKYLGNYLIEKSKSHN